MARKTREKARRPINRDGRPPRQILVQHTDKCRGCDRTVNKGSAAFWKAGSGLACLTCGPSYL